MIVEVEVSKVLDMLLQDWGTELGVWLKNREVVNKKPGYFTVSLTLRVNPFV